jgi:N-methylhydantoinase A
VWSSRCPDSQLTGLVTAVRAAEVEAVAVCLLFGFLHPEHEQRVGQAIRAALPEVAVSLSSELLPEFREYERMATVTADAYLAPRVTAYLRRLAGRIRERGLPAPLVMQSSGGVAEIDLAAAQPARLVLSGPAGGVIGATYIAARSGFGDLLTFDMGGTSTDVAAVVGGAVQTTTESVLAGVPIKLSAVDVHSVSAGGGSVAWADEGGALRVGPRSAGADPGPAALRARRRRAGGHRRGPAARLPARRRDPRRAGRAVRGPRAAGPAAAGRTGWG